MIAKNFLFRKEYLLIPVVISFLIFISLSGCSDQDKNSSGLGAVAGRITDDKGVAVEAASISVFKNDNSWASSDDGAYYLHDLTLGVNVVTIEKFGYQTWVGEVSVDDSKVTGDFNISLKEMIRELKFYYETTGVLKIKWQTPDKTESYLEYGIESDNYKWKVRNNIASREHEVVLGDIDPAKKYYYRINYNEFEKTSESTFRVEDFDIPKSVVLNNPSTVGTDSVTLTWSKSIDTDFREYRVHRSETASVTSTSLLLGASSTVDAPYFLDSGLAPGKTYYYRIFVMDSEGFFSGSNIVSIRTYSEPNMPPESIVLNPVQNLTYSSFDLYWTKSSAADFYSYRTIVSELSSIDLSTMASASTFIFEETDPNGTSIEVKNLKSNTNYYIKVFVMDKGGLSSSSNSISTITPFAPDDPPLAVTLLEALGTGADRIRLTWTASAERDFDSYHIYYDTVPGITMSSTLAKSIGDKSITTWFVTPLLDNREYFFKIFVKDQAGNFTGSNEYSGTTMNDLPPAVNITGLSPVTASNITLNWTPIVIADFNAYMIYRSTTPGVDQTATLLTVINTITQSSYQDTSVNIGNTYYYKIYTKDDAGLITGGSEVYTTALDSSAVAGTITQDMLWTVANSPITVVGDISVSPGVTIKIEAGVTVNFSVNSDSRASGNDISRAELIVNGTIDAQGTAGNPIIFTSAGAVKNNGDWGGIEIATGSVNSVLKNCEIGYAREYGLRIAALATVDHCSISQNLFSGIEVSAISPSISNCSIYGNSTGIICEASGNPVISDSNIMLNNVYAVSSGGKLGLTASSGLVSGTGGNYIAGNGTAAPNEIDMTGTSSSLGSEDNVMSTSSDTSPVQISNVDIVKTAVMVQISTAGIE